MGLGCTRWRWVRWYWLGCDGAELSGVGSHPAVVISPRRVIAKVVIGGGIWHINLSIDSAHTTRPFSEIVMKTALYHFNLRYKTTASIEDILVRCRPSATPQT